MSQVIIENDKYKDKRLKSADQEMRIDRESGFKKWHRSDVTGFDPVATVVGLVLAPLVVFFWIFSKVSQLAIYVSLFVSQVISKIVGKMKNT